jgi:hypothetical protein
MVEVRTRPLSRLGLDDPLKARSDFSSAVQAARRRGLSCYPGRRSPASPILEGADDWPEFA